MLDFIKDIFAAFKQSSVERVKNPFIGAFAFSWIGFNWQVIAILLFSNVDVIERVKYIKNNYDVGGFVLAPALTAIVICIILPEANKLFTKLQKKPINETVDILMQSKIDIAGKQLEIADIEAKKQLAHKREERNIEENIEAIRRELQETKDLNESLKIENISSKDAIKSERENVSKLTKNLTDIQISLSEEKISREKLLEEINNKQREINDIKHIKSQWDRMEPTYLANMELAKETLEDKNRQIAEITKRGDDIIKKYPNLFQPDEAGVIMVRQYADEKLQELDDEMYKRLYG